MVEEVPAEEETIVTKVMEPDSLADSDRPSCDSHSDGPSSPTPGWGSDDLYCEDDSNILKNASCALEVKGHSWQYVRLISATQAIIGPTWFDICLAAAVVGRQLHGGASTYRLRPPQRRIVLGRASGKLAGSQNIHHGAHF